MEGSDVLCVCVFYGAWEEQGWKRGRAERNGNPFLRLLITRDGVVGWKVLGRFVESLSMLKKSETIMPITGESDFQTESSALGSDGARNGNLTRLIALQHGESY